MDSLTPRANIATKMGHIEEFWLVMNVCEVSIADERRVTIVPYMIDACGGERERERG
tara:strand:+ start:1007 stop:1177 length:171 start_codon:yes stop_codon:yes gene_type:complete